MKKLFLLMLSIFACCTANAQVTTSGMNGTVVDQNGQPLVGATVIAVHTPSGTQYGAVTDKNGNYNLQGLRTGGPYSVTFSFVGYQSVEFPGLMLSLGQTLKRDAFLKDSQELEAVVIKADGKNSSMNVNRAGAVTSISNEQIELMPTVNRSMNDIMKLTPQASSTTSGLAIGGGNYRQSYVTVDGAAFNNMFGIGGNLPAGGSPISLDALEQVSVSVTPFDVRQSGFTGGAINAVTKSGTNDLKVSAYLYSKSDQLQGDKYDGGKLSLSEMRDNTLGFSIGAPIIKNKLFVFANFEREWNTTPGNSRLARTNDTGEFGGNTQYNRPTASKLDEMSQFLIDNYGYNPGPRGLEHQPQPRAQRTLQPHPEQVFVGPVVVDLPAQRQIYIRQRHLRPYLELRHVFPEFALLSGTEFHVGSRRTELALPRQPSDQHAALHLLASVRAAQLRRRHLPDSGYSGAYGQRRQRPVRFVRSRSLHRGQPPRSIDPHRDRRNRLHHRQESSGGRSAIRA